MGVYRMPKKAILMKKRLLSSRFPRASKYSPDWVTQSVSGAANPLWLAEWLAEGLALKTGMKVLDLGCGRAASSIFLCREYRLQVWATDLWFSVSENFERIRDAGVQANVFPLHADARSLPFAAEFFDAIVCIDSFPYFGTDDLYLPYLMRFVKPGGQVGIAGAGLMQELDAPVPAHLRDWWSADLWSLHSAKWWQRHWQRTGIVDVRIADTLKDGWKYWLDWVRLIAPDNRLEAQALTADSGTYLGYVRIVGCRRTDAQLPPPTLSVPTRYHKRALLRSSGKY